MEAPTTRNPFTLTPGNETHTFTIDETLQAYALPLSPYLKENQPSHQARGLTPSGICTSTLIFNKQGHLLVLQRASHDSMPNRWEPPGGSVDPDDASILHAAARELREEAGLIVSRFRSRVSGLGHVRLDPNEHQAFAWATEEHVRSQTLDGRPLPITNDAMRTILLEAFRLRRELNGL
ncbi:NUDIX domain protein [Ophiocordyceps camponoti-floridani]|uniref:NUDIX domain protein n=1 Tax=Ophiocordyceps camponoti-floridani TaxID=2030778 RepID=A0A8H4Q825_9HYPO|nr:NUDIX domain protein [Ophiocordyceps camponoti-floridani]